MKDMNQERKEEMLIGKRTSVDRGHFHVTSVRSLKHTGNLLLITEQPPVPTETSTVNFVADDLHVE